MTVPIKGGRPLKFNSVQELQDKIAEYFKWAEEKGKPLTIERLACFLQTDRFTLLNYEDREDYFHTIKAAKQIIYASKAEMLNTKEGNTAGIIFDLCNNGDGYTNSHQAPAASHSFIFQKADGTITEINK